MSESKEMVIILTGASRGIGLAIAHHLLSHSHKLILISRTHSALDQLHYQYGSERVEVLAGDLADFSLAKKAVELANDRWGRLDGLIVNHGTLDPVKKIGDSSVEEWRKAFDVNVFSAVGLIQASLLSLRASHGRIILTSSGAALSAYQGWGAYGAGKAVLNHLAQTLSVEEPDVSTISIRPGVVDTEMQREIREVHHESMSEKDRVKFAGLKKEGGLLRPEQPGHVIAKIAVAQREQVKGLNGKFLNWNDQNLSMYQEE
ncbi:NAD(P)-binding protein [Setomelanomma holmii]|uniref:NAD(P)-binding protein n=1 Tax=Setomelanomma holmii TaxID=210430 RepID=A0A9P4H0Z7_9PLEO|nr:NAD(P)-binding protein [Setomelanomma holmii]